MGKRIRKTKKAEICLEPDGYSVHTLELSQSISKQKWNWMKEKLYKKQRKRGGRSTFTRTVNVRASIFAYNMRMQESGSCRRSFLWERVRRGSSRGWSLTRANSFICRVVTWEFCRTRRKAWSCWARPSMRC